MAPTIRPARHDELDALVTALEWLFVAPGARPALYDPARARATFGVLIDAADATVLVGGAGPDAVAGLCTVVLDVRSARYGQRAWVEDLVVDPALRSTGIGKALLDAAKAWGRERGATHLELDSGDLRADAHRFYEREAPSWTSRQFAWEL